MEEVNDVADKVLPGVVVADLEGLRNGQERSSRRGEGWGGWRVAEAKSDHTYIRKPSNCVNS